MATLKSITVKVEIEVNQPIFLFQRVIATIVYTDLTMGQIVPKKLLIKLTLTPQQCYELGTTMKPTSQERRLSTGSSCSLPTAHSQGAAQLGFQQTVWFKGLPFYSLRDSQMHSNAAVEWYFDPQCLS